MGYKELENHRPEVRDLEKLEENPTSGRDIPWLPAAILTSSPLWTVLLDGWIQYIGLAWGFIGWCALVYIIKTQFLEQPSGGGT